MRSTPRLRARQCCVADIPARIAIDAGACTRIGSRREHNEDSHYFDSSGHAFVVADGVGGASAGERASRMAVDLLPRHLSWIPASEDREEVVVDAIRAAFAETNAAILQAAEQSVLLHKMGTTAVMALFIGGRLYVASIGDSRAYVVRAGRIEQLTVDHTMAQALVEAGTISPTQARRHQWRNVLSKFLGNAEKDNAVDVRVLELQSDDQIVLATDGLTEVIEEATMLCILQENFNAQDAAASLIQAAEQKNARDDATCIVLFVRDMDQTTMSDWWFDSPVKNRMCERELVAQLA